MDVVFGEPHEAATGSVHALEAASSSTNSSTNAAPAGWEPIKGRILRKRAPAKAKRAVAAQKAGVEILQLVDAAAVTMHLAASESGEDYVFGLHHLMEWLHQKCTTELNLIKEDPTDAASLLGIIQADIVSVVTVIEKLPEPSCAAVFKVISASLRHAMSIANAVEESM